MYWRKDHMSKIFLVLGILGSLVSFVAVGQGAWLLRMAGLVLILTGVQWLPRIEDWLRTHARERLLIATASGLVLVWMLVQYSLVRACVKSTVEGNKEPPQFGMMVLSPDHLPCHGGSDAVYHISVCCAA